MIHCTKINNCINHVHERASRIPFSNYEYSSDQSILKDNPFNNHHHNQQKLAIDTFKVKIVIAPATTDTVIRKNGNWYVFRGEIRFKAKIFHSECYGVETLSYAGA